MKEIIANITLFILTLLCAVHFVLAFALVFASVFMAVFSFVVLILVNVFCPHEGQGNKQMRKQRFDTPHFHLPLNNENIYAGVCGMSASSRAYIYLGKVWALAAPLWAMKNTTKYVCARARIYGQARRL